MSDLEEGTYFIAKTHHRKHPQFILTGSHPSYDRAQALTAGRQSSEAVNLRILHETGA